ncbi:gene transfer agent family protein [Paracoccus aminophilus]|uniref:Uncharacterized protein n=1 Tax=Paracoccus aminophilus JCM 7686 TaxID=1367847 RepID=S5XY21_PARAH|nr:gene transfer agent family protein [Paracoccus aminophilus]AGT08350.1 hypothetical protein JCM7686_1248 [Paracoccus aminophilus JCM 7686]
MREPEFLNWAGGEHPFLHRIGELLALEKSCDSTTGEIYERLGSSLVGALRWGVRDVSETIRLGLIGGGMDPGKARELTLGAISSFGLMALAPTALAALYGSLRGDDEEVVPDGDGLPQDEKKTHRKARS